MTEHSDSNYSSHVVLIGKTDTSLICIDFSRLYFVTDQDAHLIPNMEYLLSLVSNATFYF